MVLLLDQTVKTFTCAARFGPLEAPRSANKGTYDETILSPTPSDRSVDGDVENNHKWIDSAFCIE
jgi:hypothetical protein